MLLDSHHFEFLEFVGLVEQLAHLISLYLPLISGDTALQWLLVKIIGFEDYSAHLTDSLLPPHHQETIIVILAVDVEWEEFILR